MHEGNIMHIAVIVPVSTDKWNQMIEGSVRQNLSSDVAFAITNLANGPQAIQSEYDEARAVPYILEKVKHDLDGSCDAMVIWCFSDPGLLGAREISTVPVLGIGEASQALALNLADRIGIITTLQNSVNRIMRKIKARKLDGRITAIRPLEMPVLEYDQIERLKARALETARVLVNKDGAEAIILGCGAIAGVRSMIQKDVGVPVIDPGAVTLRQAEALARSGLCHSKRSFMVPRPVPENE